VHACKEIRVHGSPTRPDSLERAFGVRRGVRIGCWRMLRQTGVARKVAPSEDEQGRNRTGRIRTRRGSSLVSRKSACRRTSRRQGLLGAR
jgi:hypothetical protein